MNASSKVSVLPRNSVSGNLVFDHAAEQMGLLKFVAFERKLQPVPTDVALLDIRLFQDPALRGFQLSLVKRSDESDVQLSRCVFFAGASLTTLDFGDFTAFQNLPRFDNDDRITDFAQLRQNMRADQNGFVQITGQ